MTHNNAQKLFALILLALVAGALWLTHGWLYKVYLFPRVVAVIVILLLLVHLATLFRNKGEPATVAPADAAAVAKGDDGSARDERARMVRTVVWLLGFVILIVLLGFPIGGTLATLLYIRFTARESWRMALGAAVVVALFFGITGHPKLMGVPYPKGWVISRLFTPKVSDSYAGETVRIVVGFAPDGGVDRGARILAEHMQKYIPGKPTIIVENMPGADSIVAANYMYSLAPRDGTVFATVSSGLIVQELIKAEGVNFKSAEFNWLGAVTNTRLVCLANKETGIRSLTDLMKPRAKPLVAGGLGPVSQRTYMPNFLRMAGAQIRVASGYPSTGQVNLALEQGEVDMICGTWAGFKVNAPQLLESGRFNVFVQDGDTRDPALRDTELLKDALAGEPDFYQLWLSLTRSESTARPFLLPPGVPAKRIAILRAAFEKTMKDPGFIAANAKLGDGFEPSSGEEVEAAIHEVMATPPDRREMLKTLLSAE